MSEVCGTCGGMEDFPANPKSELAPYGPGGSLICAGCAFGTPEAEEVAKANFFALLDAAEAMSPDGVAVIGTREGPAPFSVRGGTLMTALSGAPQDAESTQWECEHHPRCADSACSHNPAVQAWAKAIPRTMTDRLHGAVPWQDSETRQWGWECSMGCLHAAVLSYAEADRQAQEHGRAS